VQADPSSQSPFSQHCWHAPPQQTRSTPQAAPSPAGARVQPCGVHASTVHGSPSSQSSRSQQSAQPPPGQQSWPGHRSVCEHSVVRTSQVSPVHGSWSSQSGGVQVDATQPVASSQLSPGEHSAESATWMHSPPTTQ
jgi:hypothetical protein